MGFTFSEGKTSDKEANTYIENGLGGYICWEDWGDGGGNGACYFIPNDQGSVSDKVTKRRAEAIRQIEAKHSIVGRGNGKGHGHCTSFLLLL